MMEQSHLTNVEWAGVNEHVRTALSLCNDSSDVTVLTAWKFICADRAQFYLLYSDEFEHENNVSSRGHKIPGDRKSVIGCHANDGADVGGMNRVSGWEGMPKPTGLFTETCLLPEFVLGSWTMQLLLSKMLDPTIILLLLASGLM